VNREATSALALLVARMEQPGPASGRPDDKLRVIRDRLSPDYASLHPGYESAAGGSKEV